MSPWIPHAPASRPSFSDLDRVIEAARSQLEQIGFLYNQRFTSPAQERLARELIALAPGLAHVHLTSVGAEANETLCAGSSGTGHRRR